MTVKEFMSTQAIITKYTIKPKRLINNYSLEAFDKCTLKKVELGESINYETFAMEPIWVISVDPKELV